MTKRLTLKASFSPFEHPNVDEAAGIIRDVILMARGPIKWDRGFADDETLRTVKECALERYGEDGIPIIFNPETFNHGPGPIAGAGKDLRINERGLVCDLHVLQEFEHRKRLFELANKQPRTIGLSIEYYPEASTVNGKEYMRCIVFDGAAVVYTPAATPGLFYSSKGGEKTISVDTKDKKGDSQSALLAIRKPQLLKFKN